MPPPLRNDRLRAAHAFTLKELGPKSHSHLKTEAGEVELERRLESEMSMEDAALGAVFLEVSSDAVLAGEFFGYFASVLLQSNRSAINGPLAKHYDRDDLVQSVLGDVLPKMGDLSFETSGQFLAFLLQKLTWKRTDKYRYHGAGVRDDDRSVPLQSQSSADQDPLLFQEPSARTPLTQLTHEEDEGRIVLALNRLPQQAQGLLRHRLEGGGLTQEYATELGVEYSSLRKLLERARGLLQKEIERLHKPSTPR